MTDILSQIAPNQDKPNNSQSSPVQVKKWAKISAKSFLIWCGIFWLFFLLIIFLGLYYAITSPEILKSVWLEVDTVKTLLMVFAVIFFGSLVVVWFLFLIINWYRLATVKTGKSKFVVWAISWFFIFILALSFGTFSILKVRSLSWTQQIKSDNIILPYLEMKDRNVWLWEWVKVIAPAYISFQINKDVFNAQIGSSIGSNTLTQISLDCWNGQILQAGSSVLNWTSSYFPEKCLFLEKKAYILNLTYTYVDRTNWEPVSNTVNVWTVIVDAAINVKISPDSYRLNDSKTEIIAWNAPVLVEFDGEDLFTNLWVPDNKIRWDFDWDGNVDKEDKAVLTFSYNIPKLYDVYFSLPSLYPDSSIYYTFKLRVNESWTSQCSILLEQRYGNDYIVNTEFSDVVDVKLYTYQIKEADTWRVVEKKSMKTSKFWYKFPEWWSYEVDLKFTTADGKEWSCVSEVVNTLSLDYDVKYILQAKQWNDTKFTDLQVTWDNLYSIDVVPSTLRLQVQKVVSPNSDLKDYKLSLDMDWENIPLTSKDVFEFDIKDEWDKNLTLGVEDTNWKKIEKKISLSVQQKPLIAKIVVSPDSWEEPLDVELDASISQLNDEEDEILYFTWDFWDGSQILENVSYGKVSHTYYFDTQGKTGQYSPKVSITSKKWLKDTFVLTNWISVKRQQREIKIISESHPTQTAKVWETINFSVETDGPVTGIRWDYGNDKIISCEWRECSSVSTTYDETGTYIVRVSVSYSDYPEVSYSIKFKINE